MPPNLVTLFAHVMSRANEGGSRGSAAHSWDEVLNPAPAPSSSSSSASASTSSSASSCSSSGTTSPGPFFCPMSAQDWRKAEAFSVHLQSLLAARQTLYNSHSNGGGRGAAAAAATGVPPPHSNGDGGGQAPSSSFASSSSASSFSGEAQISTPHAPNGGRAKGGGRAKPLAATSGSAAAAAAAAATPNPASAWPRQQGSRVTPKEPPRGGSGEPSAPIKVVGRVAASRRVNGSAEGAVASLAVSRAGPGAFETPAHSTSQHHHHHLGGGRPGAGLPGADNTDLRGREHSPSRYPARVRSRRFPQLGGGGESPDTPQPRGLGHHGLEAAEDGRDGDQLHGGRRLSPRNSPPTMMAHEHGRRVSSDDWLVAAAGGGTQKGAAIGGRGRGGEFTQLGRDVNGYEHDGGGGSVGDVSGGASGSGGADGESYGMRTRAAPRASHDLSSAAAGPSSGSSSSSPLPGACTPQMGTGAVVSPEPMGFRPAPPPIISASAAAAAVAVTAAAVRPSPRAELVAPRPRQVLQGGGRSGGRAPPLLRSSVGGRNYTDNHVKQLGLIEAAVVASATARDRATYNLPRQGRTLTLTNVFKFIALHGAGAMYRLAMDKQVEAHTGRHSNFFDGKIDARIVGVIKKDIGDEVITKSRKFSKILLSLIAEGDAIV